MVLLIKPWPATSAAEGSPAQAARAGRRLPGFQVPGSSTEVTWARCGLGRR
jgi:hypothetical protein